MHGRHKSYDKLSKEFKIRKQMIPNKKTIYYKNFQIDIAPESLADGKWQPQWHIWITDEAKKFSAEEQFSSAEEATEYSEKSAKEYLDKTA